MIWYGTRSPTQAMILASPLASIGLAIDAIAMVASTCPVRTAATMFPIGLQRPQRDRPEVDPSFPAIRPTM